MSDPALSGFDLSGALRRIRRRADLSQRELADACGLSQSVVARAESGRRQLTVAALARAAAIAGLRLALLDTDGDEVLGMSGASVRDGIGRRYPAHLDIRYGDDRWWHGPERYTRKQPWYTFDRDRELRDLRRSARGRPEDHQLPAPGDSPEERARARRLAALARRDEELRQREEAAPWRPHEESWTCECPPRCAELDDYSGRPVHTPECPCQCDVG